MSLLNDKTTSEGKDGLVSIIGKFAPTYKKFASGTLALPKDMIHSEVLASTSSDGDLDKSNLTRGNEDEHYSRNHLNLNNSHIVGLTPVYVNENGNPVLYIIGEPNSPVFNNIDEAASQMFKQGHYNLEKNEYGALIENATTLEKINLEDVRARQETNANNRKPRSEEMHIYPLEMGRLNDEEKKLVEMIYGTGEQLDKNMQAAYKSRINQFSKSLLINFLTKEYILSNVKDEHAIAHLAVINLNPTGNFNVTLTSNNQFENFGKEYCFYITGIPKVGGK